MSGLSEILLILLIVIVLFFLPRMVSRPAPPARRPARRPLTIKLAGRWRLFILVSVVWLAAAVLWFQPWAGAPTRFVVLGAGPVIVSWGLVWVVAGFRRRR